MTKRARFLLSIPAFLLLSGTLHARVVHVNSVEEYQQLVSQGKPVVTMYSATWCGPCKAMKPHFIEAAKEAKDMTFCLVDTGKHALKGICKGILSIPTVIFSHKGKTISQERGGLSRKQMHSSVRTFRSTVSSSHVTQETQKVPPSKPGK